MYWLISASSKIYNHSDAFKKFGFIDWRESANYKVGDYVYIYSTRPIRKIKYKCIVEKINLKFSEIFDDKEFWINQKEYEKSKKKSYFRLRLIEENNSDFLTLNELKENGLKAAPQGPKKLDDSLLSYIDQYFNIDIYEYYTNDQNSELEELQEGLGVKVKVNRYERNQIARNKCIEYKGSKCVICGFDFGEFYGDFAKGFIHVHHIIPISYIKSNYIINYKEDLIPVCPNCHAMLHHKVNSRLLTIEQLMGSIRTKKL